MSDSNEPSYYEIALTNRQVLVAFVILLLAVLLAFLGGVWLGRKGTAGPSPAGTQEQTSNSGQQEGQTALKQFNFFSDEAKSGKTEKTAQSGTRPESTAPSASSTLEGQVTDSQSNERRGGVTGKTAIAQPQIPSAPPPKAQPQVVTKPEVQQPQSSSASSPGKAASSSFPETTSGDLVIQVFSSANLQQAEEVTSRLKKAGYRAFLSPVKVGGKIMHRVRIGPFEQQAEAARIAEKIRKSFKLDTWITH